MTKPNPSNTPWTRAKARKFITRLLREVRQEVAELRLKPDRLPGWVSAASVRFGWGWNTLIIAIEDSTYSEDKLDSLDIVMNDAQVLIKGPAFYPERVMLKLTEGIRQFTIQAETVGKAAIIVLGDKSSFLNLLYLKKHGPICISGIAIQKEHDFQPYIPISLRIIPISFYLSWDDYHNQDETIGFCKEKMVKLAESTASSDVGKSNEEKVIQTRVFEASNEKSVIILGAYDTPHNDELVSVRDYLSINHNKYKSNLIVDFPDIKGLSTRQKAAQFCMVAKFSIMVDRVTSGHLFEFADLEKLKLVLAVLRPKGGGSTCMMDDHLDEIGFIEVFEFLNSPMEVIDQAVAWAEALVQKRIKKN